MREAVDPAIPSRYERGRRPRTRDERVIGENAPGVNDPTAATTATADPATATTADPATRRPWRRAFLVGLVVFVSSRIGLACVTGFAWIDEYAPAQTPSRLYRWVVHYDANWFLMIAQGGYPRTEHDAAAAFFPSYPALIRLFTPVLFGRAWLAALFVSNVALLAALVLLYRLAEHEFGRAPAGRTIFYLVAFPTGLYLSSGYNESLFIALMVGSVYCMRRGHWWLAGALAGLAATTRSAGLLLALAFGYEYLRQYGWRIRANALAGGLIPLGTAAVMVVDQIYFDDPLAFSRAQSAHWGREPNWPWVAIVDTFRSFGLRDGAHTPFGVIWAHNLLELGTVLLLLAMIGLSFVGPWRMRRDQRVLPLFGLTLIIFMMSFPSTFEKDIPYPLLSCSRIGLEVFPAFMLMGRLGHHRGMDRTFLAVFLLIQGVLISRFLHNDWVA